MNGLNALRRDPWELSCLWEHSEKMAIYEHGSRFSSDIESAGAYLGIPSLPNGLFKPPRLCSILWHSELTKVLGTVLCHLHTCQHRSPMSPCIYWTSENGFALASLFVLCMPVERHPCSVRCLSHQCPARLSVPCYPIWSRAQLPCLCLARVAYVLRITCLQSCSFPCEMPQ